MKRSSKARPCPVGVVIGKKEYIGSYEIIPGQFPSIRVSFGGRRKETQLGPQGAATFARTLLRELIR